MGLYCLLDPGTPCDHLAAPLGLLRTGLVEDSPAVAAIAAAALADVALLRCGSLCRSIHSCDRGHCKALVLRQHSSSS